MTASSATAMGGASPSFSPEAATSSGDGVSPAAMAAASGSPPGSEAANWVTDAGRARGSRSRQRRITRSTSEIDAGPDVGRRPGRGVFLLVAQLREALRGKRRLAATHFVEHQAERIDVAAHRRALAGQLLGRHVGGRAGHLAFHRLARHADGEAEVGNPGAAVPVDHDVRRLQVAMQHATGVRRGEAGAQLPCDGERLLARRASRCASAATPGLRRR